MSEEYLVSLTRFENVSLIQLIPRNGSLIHRHPTIYPIRGSSLIHPKSIIQSVAAYRLVQNADIQGSIWKSNDLHHSTFGQRIEANGTIWTEAASYGDNYLDKRMKLRASWSFTDRGLDPPIGGFPSTVDSRLKAPLLRHKPAPLQSWYTSLAQIKKAAASKHGDLRKNLTLDLVSDSGQHGEDLST
ncbi:hypothetical protein BT69DRAFT_1295112 [Atractiella rhizophila]|nr:hypothetical protein BT69DRAFT_1295112 [Atractiella rhizophila]